MTHRPDLHGEVALVTGAASGIGRAVAIELAAAGAQVVVNDLGSARSGSRAVVAEIEKAGGFAIAIDADIRIEAEVDRMFDRIRERLGGLRILVNNAGIERNHPIAEMPLDAWQQVIDVNLTGQFLCARGAVREFLRRPTEPPEGKARGKIVCMSSVHQTIPWAGHANYAASKGGAMLLVKSLAQELAAQRIRVNAVAPGAIRTPINRAAWADEAARAALLRLIPYGRIGVPEDVARAVLWLASDASDYVTGATLVVDGGMSLYPAFATGAG